MLQVNFFQIWIQNILLVAFVFLFWVMRSNLMIFIVVPPPPTNQCLHLWVWSKQQKFQTLVAKYLWVYYTNTHKKIFVGILYPQIL